MRRLHIADSCRDHKNRVDFYSNIATFRHTMTSQGPLCGFFVRRKPATGRCCAFHIFTFYR